MRTIVLVNAAAGAVASGRPVAEDSATEPPALSRLQEAVRQAGLQAEVVPVEPHRLPEAVARAAASPEIDAVCVAGGDGTVNSAASVMAGSHKPLGVLPLGTLNHFARDIGMPIEPEDAAAAIAAGRWRDVDVGEVNGRVFVNNCSMGLYPEAVRGREERRDRGAPKWPAMLQAMRDALQRLPLLRLTLRTDDRTMRVATPLLMVGNNRYQTDLLRLGQRESLDEGRLWVYLTRSTGAGGVVKLGLRALAGRLEQTRDFESLSTTSLHVDDRRRRRRLPVAVDGELTELVPPLVLRSRPRGLRVLAPAGNGS
jgi:diacylglycerol kinase family enzyme